MSDNKCITCGYPYRPSFGPCPNCGATIGKEVKKSLKVHCCLTLVVILGGLLFMLLEALGLMPEQ